MLEQFIPYISSIVSTLIPFKDSMLKVQIGLMVGEIVRIIIQNKNSIRWMPFNQKKQVIIFNKNEKNDVNPIYYKLEEYIINKCFNDMKTFELVPKKGELTLSIFDNREAKLQVVWEDKKVDIHFDQLEDENNQKRRCIVFSSTTESMEFIKEFIHTICKHKLHNNIITIYRPLRTKLGKKDCDYSIDWDTVYIKTNKTKENTIYSKEINEEFFDDVKWFMENEDWFSSRGIPYKRGYVLHGKPGTGKTSMAKILANHYELPIFIIDLETIKNNSDFVRLSTDISYFTQNKKYILLIEDMDRSSLLNDSYGTDLSQCCLLNILDGVVETHGRICLLTANNIEKFQLYFDQGELINVWNLIIVMNIRLNKLQKYFIPILNFQKI